MTGEKFLASLEDELTNELSKAFLDAGLEFDDSNIALNVASAVTDSLCLSWGGLQMYIPIDSYRRAQMMYRDFTGDNYAEIALKYGVTASTVRSHIKRLQDKKRQASAQCSLFE